MPKSPRRRDPAEQYDRFMIGGKTPRTPRGILLLVGGLVGNSVLWLLGLITVALRHLSHDNQVPLKHPIYSQRSYPLANFFV